jgi:hypothetical protein
LEWVVGLDVSAHPTRTMIKTMKQGSVFVDIAIDQGAPTLSHGFSGAERTRLPLNALTSNQKSNCNARRTG